MLMALPQQGQITRHICVEGWSQIGQWSGVPLGAFLRRVGADLSARYVYFKCFDGYSTSIDMASALQPQTILALDFPSSYVEATSRRRLVPSPTCPLRQGGFHE
jgi:DMSO/TMAO reductase YedYZ molybdopterin-dependent catalytic subunit